MSAPESQRIITIDEFAQRSGLNRTEVQALFNWDRSLKIVRIGNRKFTTETELKKFCDFWKLDCNE